MKKIAIIYGGPSKEHEVSVRSSQNVLNNIDENKYEILEIFIDKKLNFFVVNKRKRISLAKIGLEGEKGFVKYLKQENVNVILPIMHGEYGEGGKFQKLLEKAKIEFAFSDSKSSSLAMDKNLSGKLYLKSNINTPKTKIITKEKYKHNFSYPIIIKPVNEGSSVDLFKIDTEKEYLKSSNKIFKNHEKMLLQECIEGREFTCAVVEFKNKKGEKTKPKALLPSEIILTKSKTFDYNSKYTPNACLEITPPNIDKKYIKKIQKISEDCHAVLGCKDVSRTDMILSAKDNKFYVLETNTIPGMTETSFLPQQLEKSGYSMGIFIENLIK